MIDDNLDFVRVKDRIFSPFHKIENGHRRRYLMTKDCIEPDYMNVAVRVVHEM
jgi:hypothetical protein